MAVLEQAWLTTVSSLHGQGNYAYLSAPPGPDLGQVQLHRAATRWREDSCVGLWAASCFPVERTLSVGL